MANSQTYMDGRGGNGGVQVTTLSDIQANGLQLPPNVNNFIDTRAPGKLEVLFNTGNNSTVLYTTNKPQNIYLKGPLAERLDYVDINKGQQNEIKTASQSSINDARLITKFLGTTAGTRFILRQLYIQGLQPFDETKIYNPASPILAAVRLATFGIGDRPIRHIDTSNIVGGLIGAAGLGSAVRLVGGLFGGGPPLPSPPRSSVASEASRGGFFSAATFTSLLGGGDRSDQVVSPLARPDVKGLLRGQTATNAYNSPRYIKLANSSQKGGLFSRLLGAAGRFLQNNTLIGGILPPKQPWAADFRADEKTYDYYLNAGKLFKPDDPGIASGGVLSGVLNSLGFGKKANYSLAVTQRFSNSSLNTPDFNRTIIVSRNDSIKTKKWSEKSPNWSSNTSTEITNQIGVKTLDSDSTITTTTVYGDIQTGGLKYSELVGLTPDGNSEQSDQLLNYKVLTDSPKNFTDTFTDIQNSKVKDIAQDLSVALKNILGTNSTGKNKYSVIDRSSIKTIIPSQFDQLNFVSQQFENDNVGFNYLNNIKSNDVNGKYTNRFKDQTAVPTRLGKQTDKDRFIRPTNDVDYVNALDVLDSFDFDNNYNSTKNWNGMGPDIIKFYFYDIVNERYIPFNATVKSLNDSNTGEWETIEYLGRPDKLYYYKGFQRQVNFNFTTVAHSIKELLPMWERINYLVGLTRPANYTNSSNGGFMVPPMVQLTLGDFYKNHNIVITSCNVTIPDDASWETIPENSSQPNKNWSWGPNRAFEWKNSSGQFAQFPRTAEISVNMNVIEKDRPYTGKAIWGNAPVKIEANGKEVFDKKSLLVDNTFSQNMRYDVNTTLDVTLK